MKNLVSVKCNGLSRPNFLGWGDEMESMSMEPPWNARHIIW